MDKIAVLKENLKKIKRKIDNQQKAMLLIELAIVMLVVAFATNYLINNSLSKFSHSDVVNTWDYIYSDQANVDFNDKMEIANSFVPMVEEKLGSYLHMRTNIASSKKDRTLVIKTDHAPIRVYVNGEEIYNNYYESSEYVGNTYNAVKIPASSAGTDVRVSAYLPFATNVDAYLEDGVTHPAYYINGGVIFSGVILLAGLASLAFLFVKRVIKNQKIRFLSAAIPLVIFGISVFVNAFTRCSYLFNLPNFYNVSLALENLCLLSLVFFSTRLVKIKKKSVPILMALDLILIIASCIPTQAALLKLVSWAVTLVTLIILAIAIAVNGTFLDRRIQYAKSMFLMLLFSALCTGMGEVFLNILRYRKNFAFSKSICIFAFVCYITFITVVRVFEFNNPEDIQSKIARYSSYITTVSDLIKNAISATSDKEGCKIICDGIYDLCNAMGKIQPENDMIASAFIKENGQYFAAYHHSTPISINPTVIENRCIFEENFCVYNETFFDIVLADEEDFKIIFHFENVLDGLDQFFISIMNTIYTCVKAAHIRYSNAENYENISEKQIFVNLAIDYEKSIDNNTEHLNSVRYYTKIFMEELGYPADICDIVSSAAMLHDIGKIAIPFEICTKSTLLTEDERAIMKKHTDFGYTLLSVFDSEFLQYASTIARDHHEKYDGTGYNKIKGEDIDKFARIVSIADVADALMAKRSYKEPWPLDKVVDYIQANSGKMFDPEVVDAMMNCLDKIKERITENR